MFSPTHLLLVWEYLDVVMNEHRCSKQTFFGNGRMPFFCLDYLLITATVWQASSFHYV